jgi:hypothetical protein
VKRGATLPVVALGRDKAGRPTRLSVPGLTRAAPIVSGGRRIGEVARDGTVTVRPWVCRVVSGVHRP